MLREIIGRVVAYFLGTGKSEERPRRAERRKSDFRERVERWATERNPSVSGQVATENFSREQREAHRRQSGGGAKGYRGTHGGPPADSGSHKDWDARPHK
ncbi:MAG TPA: hypothetical protein VHF22_15750 [Planctomycetota bacterium]|nr:hypothetical protein [Planctomycetota bacterium]